MTPISLWAQRWGICEAALDDLYRTLTPVNNIPPPPPTKRGIKSDEAYAQDWVRLNASAHGFTLWRNNVGVLTNARGVPVRYGLANESPLMNKRIKSSDLIGWRSVNIHGVKVAQFVAREVKAPGWRYAGTDREVAQKAWIDLVNAAGGDASFTTGGA